MKVQLLHLDDELIEEDYDDIQDKKFSKTSQKGWLGISDKYWIASINSTRKKRNLKLHLIIKINLELNFITTDPQELKENSIIEDKLQVIVAAKRVEVIDGYAESLKNR